MKKSLVVAVSTAAVMLLNATSAQAQAQMSGLNAAAPATANGAGIVHKVGRRGVRNGAIAAGVVLGVLGIAAAASAADRDRNELSQHERRCHRWRRWCRNGERDACWKFDNRC